MLIQNRALAKGDIAAFKLINGDEIVGRVVENDMTGITITKPISLLIQMVQTAPGTPPQAALQFGPFMAGAPEDGTYTFALAKLLANPVKAREDVAKSYIQATSSIVPASAVPGGLIA